MRTSVISVLVTMVLWVGCDAGEAEAPSEFVSSFSASSGTVGELTSAEQSSFCEEVADFQVAKTVETLPELEECYPGYVTLMNAGYADGSVSEKAKEKCEGDNIYSGCSASVEDVEKCLAYQTEQGVKLAAQFFGVASDTAISEAEGGDEQMNSEVPEGCSEGVSMDSIMGSVLSDPVAFECAALAQTCPQIFETEGGSTDVAASIDSAPVDVSAETLPTEDTPSDESEEN